MHHIFTILVCIFTIGTFSSNEVSASVLSKPIEKAAKHILKKSPKGTTLQGLTTKLSKLSTKFGNNSITFVKATGHKGMELLSTLNKGAGQKVIKFYNKTGWESWRVINNKTYLNLFLKHGNEAGKALINHTNIAEKTLMKYGSQGARALNKLDTNGAVKYTKTLINDSNFSQHGSSFSKIIEQYGQPAMDFIWNNKGTIAGGALAVTFIQDPEPYIQGTKALLVDPIENIAGGAIQEITKNIAWNWIAIPIAFTLFLAFGGVRLIRRIFQQMN